jgi:hypothetical protein
MLPNPAKPPAMIAFLKASRGLCPETKPPAKEPKPVAKNIGIVGSKNGAAIGSTIGATFLTIFFRPLNNFLRKNSG